MMPVPVPSKLMLGETRSSGGQPPKRSMPGTVGHLSSASRTPSSSRVREEVDLSVSGPPAPATPPTWIV